MLGFAASKTALSVRLKACHAARPWRISIDQMHHRSIDIEKGARFGDARIEYQRVTECSGHYVVEHIHFVSYVGK